jgi:hypothetical protein
VGHTYWLYIDADTNTPTWLTDAFPGFDQVLVSFSYYHTAEKLGFKETHGLMQHQSHKEFHETVGTYRSSGGTVPALSWAANTSTTNAVTPDTTDCTIYDEDLKVVIPELIAIAPATNPVYTRVHFDSGVAVFTTGSALPFPNDGTDIQYNQNPLAGTALTSIATNGRYVNVYGIFLPVDEDADSQVYRILWMTGQQIYTTAAAAQGEDFRSLQLGNLTTIFPEFVPFIRLTYGRQVAGGSGTTFNAFIPTNGVSYLVGNKMNLTSVSGFTPTDHNTLTGRTDADSHPAAAITNTPAGDIAAVTVQAALNELDTDKIAAPAATTDNAVVRFDNAGGTTPNKSQNSLVTISDAGLIDTPSSIQTDTINEHTGTAGVTVDSVLIKDGQVGLLEPGGPSRATLVAPALAADITITTPAATGTLATLAGTDVITNKDIDGGTASNTSRIALPKNTLANLNGLTDKEASVGFATDTKKIYVNDGTDWKVVGGGLITEYKSASFNAEAGKHYLVNLAGGDVTATLPAGAAESVIAFSTFGNHADATKQLIIDGNASETILYYGTEYTDVTLLPVCGWVQLMWSASAGVGGAWTVNDQATFVSGTFAGDLAVTGKGSFVGSLGVGTTTPSDYYSGGDDLVVYGSGHSGITVASGTTSTGGLFFADGTSGTAEYEGFIQYDHNTNKMSLGAVHATVVTLDAGNVGIGTASPGARLHSKGAGTTSATLALLLTDSSDVNLANFYNNGEVYLKTSAWNTGGTAIGHSSGVLTTSPSSMRYKTNIQPLANEIDSTGIYSLRPVTFDYIIDGRHSFGYIAEEIEEYVPCVVHKEPKGENGELIPESVSYEHLTVLIIEEMKKLKQENEALEARLAALEAK